MESHQNLELGLSELGNLKIALDQAAIVAITDSKGVITFVNDKFCQISKYDRSELIGKTHKIINSSFHPKEFFKDMWSTISQGKVWNGEIKNKAKDGSFYWVETTIVPFVLSQPSKETGLKLDYSYVAIRFDITQQKESEENFKELFNASFEGTLVHKEGFVLNANLAASHIFEASNNTLLGQQLLNILPKEVREIFLSTFGSKKESHFEAILTKKNNTRAFLRFSSKPILYKGQAAQLLTVRDESEQRILQGQLAQQERLASIGFLASGLAHEIGTPMGVIRGRAEYLSLYPDNQKNVRSNMEIIINQIDRISKLIYSLLNVARRDNPESISTLCLNDALEDITRLLSSSLSKEGIELKLELEPNINIHANKSQLEQIFLNLLVNAIHAIKTRSLTDKSTRFQITLKAIVVGEYWEICLTDNGCGIAESHLKHIFEPFFTTKDPGSGTGLGLSIVQQIIFSWRGNIRCESKENIGTSFFIRIPKA